MGANFDTNTDGICSAQRELNDIVIIISVFAMLIWLIKNIYTYKNIKYICATFLISNIWLIYIPIKS